METPSAAERHYGLELEIRHKLWIDQGKFHNSDKKHNPMSCRCEECTKIHEGIVYDALSSARDAAQFSNFAQFFKMEIWGMKQTHDVHYIEVEYCLLLSHQEHELDQLALKLYDYLKKGHKESSLEEVLKTYKCEDQKWTS